MNLTSFLIIFSSVSLNALAQIAIKMGANQIQLSGEKLSIALVLNKLITLPIILGLSCYVLSVGIWIIALSRTQVSVAFPMQSLGYVMVTVLAWYLFNEPISLGRIIALVIIIFGVVLLAQS
jgi:drug/metabolite transporter (DMT)-like permease